MVANRQFDAGIELVTPGLATLRSEIMQVKLENMFMRISPIGQSGVWASIGERREDVW